MAYGVLYPRTKKEVDGWIKSMHEFTQELIKDRKKGRAFLIKHGFMTKSGKLGKKYRS
jgi:hypothetical protein